MSCNYADGLSPYHDKGQLGLEERFDSKSVVSAKVSLLTKWINEAKHVVVHTGAGISTSAGIPDFRGPRGVWTLQAKGEKPDLSTDFNDAIPTITHMAITKLVERGKVKYVVSQNIDGLHLRSNLQRKFLSELHGNMFTEQCSACGRQFVRSSAVPTVGQKCLNKPCPTLKANGRPCRGRLHDTILDWEHNLPENDLGMADYHSCLADLSICLGSTMQIVPSGNLPLYTKKHGGKLVICNLQPTKHNRKADLIIHAYVDEVMTMLMKNLNLKIPKYSAKNDPTKLISQSSCQFIEWTISDYAVKKMKKSYEEKCGTKEARKRLEMIDDDLPLSIAKSLKRGRGKDEDDSDLEVLDVIVKPKRSSGKRGQKKNSTAGYSSAVTMKKTPPPKKAKYETEKITIKKNVTPTKTKYEIVPPKIKKTPKCEIVYCTDNDVCNDLDMICESDDDEMTNKYTYNFKRYLYDEKEMKKEEEEGEEEEEEKKESVDIKDAKDIEKLQTNDSASDDSKSKIKKEDNNEESIKQKEFSVLNDPEVGNNDKNEFDSPAKSEGGEETVKNSDEMSSVRKAEELPDSEKADAVSVSQPSAEPEPETSRTANEELAEYLESAEEKEKDVKDESNAAAVGPGEEKDNVKNTEKSVYPNEESDFSNSNVESTMDELRSAAMSECNMGQSVNENFVFYNNEYNSSNNTTDLDYVDSGYYNNF